MLTYAHICSRMLPAAVVAAKVRGRVEYLVVPKYVVYMYKYICVSSKCILSSQHTAVYVSAYCYIFVRILVHMCPHTCIYVSAYWYGGSLKMSISCTEDALRYYCMRPYATIV